MTEEPLLNPLKLEISNRHHTTLLKFQTDPNSKIQTDQIDNSFFWIMYIHPH